ncbi:MAG: PHP domain-containing protein [bacterium]
MRFDLHTHTTASDGVLSPADLVRLAKTVGLDTLAITDHDTVAGLSEATRAATDHSIQLIPGIEISCIASGISCHILGYFIDYRSSTLSAYTVEAIRAREERMNEMLVRLASQKINLQIEDVIKEAGPERSSLGRPHLARALVTKGYASSMTDAFDRLIGDQHPAQVAISALEANEAIRLIRDAGGVAVWAHPRLEVLDKILPELVAAGLRGLEVYRPKSSPQHVLNIKARATKMDLLVTGGSDWHGPGLGVELGQFYVIDDDVSQFLREGQLLA